MIGYMIYYFNNMAFFHYTGRMIGDYIYSPYRIAMIRKV